MIKIFDSMQEIAILDSMQGLKIFGQYAEDQEIRDEKKKI